MHLDLSLVLLILTVFPVCHFIIFVTTIYALSPSPNEEYLYVGLHYLISFAGHLEKDSNHQVE